MTTLTDWEHVDLAGALAILDGWSGQRVIVSVDLASGVPGLAGMTGALRVAGHDGAALTLEFEDNEAWLRLPDRPCFLGATYAPRERVLVLEFCGDEPDSPAVLVDIQLLELVVP